MASFSFNGFRVNGADISLGFVGRKPACPWYQRAYVAHVLRRLSYVIRRYPLQAQLLQRLSLTRLAHVTCMWCERCAWGIVERFFCPGALSTLPPVWVESSEVFKRNWVCDFNYIQESSQHSMCNTSRLISRGAGFLPTFPEEISGPFTRKPLKLKLAMTAQIHWCLHYFRLLGSTPMTWDCIETT